MGRALDSRSYTNFILTVIAVLLLALALHAYRVSLTSNAFAQEPTPLIKRFATPGRGAPIDISNVAQTQDVAVAQATSEVAAANREIAVAINELGRSVQGLGASLAALAPRGAAVPAGAPPAAAAPANPAGESVIEVAPPAK